MGRSTDAGPRRRCVACRVSVPAADLVRVAWSDRVAGPTVGRTLSGRGAWLHPRQDCLNSLRPGDLARAFRRAVTPEQVADLVTQVGATLVESPTRRPLTDG